MFGQDYVIIQIKVPVQIRKQSSKVIFKKFKKFRKNPEKLIWPKYRICHVTGLTIYGKMTSYMFQNRNFELNVMVMVTCDRSNHIWKYSQFASKMTSKHVIMLQVPQPYNPFTNHSLNLPKTPKLSSLNSLPYQQWYCTFGISPW